VRRSVSRSLAIALTLLPGIGALSPTHEFLARVGFAVPALFRAHAQTINPVYVDDSPAARDTLARLPELLAARNTSEAVRSLQRLLDTEADRALELPGDSEIFVTVRRRVHETLLASPDLLGAYRENQGPSGAQALALGDFARVERSYFLTRAGAEATLRLAQDHLGHARFEAARLLMEQWLTHPDRTDAALAPLASSIMTEAARYLDRPEVWAIADRLAIDAGRPAPARERIVPPPSLAIPVASALHGTPPPALGDMVGTPLRSAPLGGKEIFTDITPEPQGRPSARGAPLYEPSWVLPLATGDTLYTNDGATVAALDRFTLQEKWRVRPLDAQSRYEPLEFSIRPNERAFSRGYDDSNTITLTRALVLATTGVATSSGRMGDPRIHALERATGRVLWSVDPADLDPMLAGGSIRGPLLVEGDTVIASFRKQITQRRLVTVYLIGLDLATGERRWITPIGSAGVQTTGRMGRSSEGAALFRGMIYRTDEVGVIAAVEASSGRVNWIRRAPAITPPPMMNGWPWGSVIPIVDERGLLTLTPDRLDVVRLDLHTGRLLGSRAGGVLEGPRYLVRVGDDLAAIGERRIALVNYENFETDTPRLTPPLDGELAGGGMSGRAFAAEDALVVPLRSGLAIVRPGAEKEPTFIPLERSGNAVIAQGQVLIADHRQLHSYLVWDVASALLRERMNAAEGDAAPAITFADLASRSGRWEDVIPAIDRAIEIIEADPLDPDVAPARARLATVLDQLVGSSPIGWGVRAPRTASGTPTIEDLSLLDELLQRFGRIASSADEQATHAMALGALRTLQGRGADAAEAYQRVLATPAIAEATWNAPGLSIRAETEATARVRQLVIEQGARVYEAFDREAAQQLGVDLGNAERLSSLARRYPASPVAARASYEAARLRLQGRDDTGALADLSNALSSIMWATQAGLNAESTLVADIGGTLIRTLARSDRPGRARTVAAQFQTRYPALVPSVEGAPLDLASTLREADALAHAMTRAPRIGPPQGNAVAQALVGWSILPVRSTERAGAADLVLLISSDGTTLAGHAPGETGQGLRELWTRPVDQPPTILWQDQRSIYLYRASTSTPAEGQAGPNPGNRGGGGGTNGNGGGVIERLDPATGASVWVSAPVRTLFPMDFQSQRRVADDIGRPLTMATPSDGVVSRSDLLFAIDGQTIAIAERVGRVAAIDAKTGQTRWIQQRPIERVYDLAVGGGVVLVGGAQERALGPDQPVELTPALVSIEAQRGGILNISTDLPGNVIWTRLDADARLLAGFEGGLILADAVRGQRLWTRWRDASDTIIDAWPLGDRLFLLDTTRTLWLADLATGVINDEPLRTDDRLATRQPITARAIDGRLVFTSARGIVVYDQTGRRVGADAIGGTDSLIPPRLAERTLVTIDTQPNQTAEGRLSYTLGVLDASSARLIATRELALLTPPDALALVDGSILISAGGVTLVIAAPDTAGPSDGPGNAP
jgi:outer membrane protein assembly factor BamB